MTVAVAVVVLVAIVAAGFYFRSASSSSAGSESFHEEVGQAAAAGSQDASAAVDSGPASLTGSAVVQMEDIQATPYVPDSRGGLAHFDRIELTDRGLNFPEVETQRAMAIGFASKHAPTDFENEFGIGLYTAYEFVDGIKTIVVKENSFSADTLVVYKDKLDNVVGLSFCQKATAQCDLTTSVSQAN